MYRDGTLPRLRNVQGRTFERGKVKFNFTDRHTDRLTFALLELLLRSYWDRTLPRLRNVQGRNITKFKECTGTDI